MNVFELTKISGAILGTALVAMVISMIGDILVPEEEAHPAAFAVHGPTEEEAEGAADVQTATAEPQDIGSLLAAATLEAGAKEFKKCKACHTIENGGPNKIGPNLWNVVGRPKGTSAEFKYSKAMSEAGGNWSYEDLDGYLRKPKEFLPGNKMNFAGIRKSDKRANLILYLRSLSDSPAPFP